MRCVIQRVSGARVRVAGETVGEIGVGFLALVCAMEGDGEKDATYVAEKIAGLRLFEDEAGKMNRCLSDAGGAVLLVSQFTLAGDARHGRRPSFSAAARPEEAEGLLVGIAEALRAKGLKVETGRFRTHMEVSLINDGPVTLLLDSRKEF